MVKCFLVEEKDASSNLAWFVFVNNYSTNISFSVLAYNIVIDKVKSLLLVHALVKKQNN